MTVENVPQNADPVPDELLFTAPERLAPALSPDGRRLAYLAPREGVLNVWVRDLAEPIERPVTAEPDRDIRGYAWTGDGSGLVFLRDVDGDEMHHVFVARPGRPVRDLTPFPGVRARIVGRDRSHAGCLLISLNLGSPRRQDLYRLDPLTGQLTLVAENPGVRQWLPSPTEAVVLGVVQDAQGALVVLRRSGTSWVTVHEVGPDDAGTSRVLGTDAAGAHLYLLSSAGAQTSRLARVNLAGGEPEVLFENPEFDVVDVSMDPRTGIPDLAQVQRDRTEVHPLTGERARDLERVLRGSRGDVRVISRSESDQDWLLLDNVSDAPAWYHRFDRCTGRVLPLFSHQPTLERYELAAMEPFVWRARDGLTVHGYLSFPPGRPRRDLPTVLLVHGGPWTRDTWGFRAEPQWLATRGYLCVQVNYRGSSGYGKAFSRAGDREWGGRMQDDLCDVLEQLMRAGVADPRRLAIMGASYGGYAALAGAAFTPHLFRCAVAAAAPVNLLTFISSTATSREGLSPVLVARVGHPESDRDLLWSRSPLSRAEAIRIPVLIAQGANDRRVPKEESAQLLAALRARGVPHEYLEFPDEGHVISRPVNRLRFYRAAERFLREHLTP